MVLVVSFLLFRRELKSFFTRNSYVIKFGIRWLLGLLDPMEGKLYNLHIGKKIKNFPGMFQPHYQRLLNNDQNGDLLLRACLFN